MIDTLAGIGIFAFPLILLTLIVFYERKIARWPEEKRKLTDVLFVLCSILGVGTVGLVLYIVNWLMRQ